MQSKTDAKGQQIRYGYDSLQRVIETDAYPAGASQADACQTVKYTYDGNYKYFQPGSPSGLGRLTGMYWSSASCQYSFGEEYSYTQWGQVSQKQVTVKNPTVWKAPDGSPANVVMLGGFRYDAEGRPSNYEMPYSFGDPVTNQNYTYDRDALGRAIDMYTGTPPQQTTNVVTGVLYNAAGQLTNMTSQLTGITSAGTWEYNPNGQLTRGTYGTWKDLKYSYGSSNNGRVASVTDNLSGETVTYTYDQLNRLVQAMTNDAWGQSYSYDGFGNLTAQTRLQGTAPAMSVAVDAATNHITTAGYAYDANGNVTQTPDGMTYGYDVANRLVSNGAVYNPRNQRVFDGTSMYYYGCEASCWGSIT